MKEPTQIRVLHVVLGLGLGGAERTVQSFLKFHSKDSVEAAVCNLGKDGERAEIIRDLGFQVFSLDGSKRKITECLESFKPHIIHINFDGNSNPLLLHLLTEARARNVVTVGSNIFSYYDQEIDELLDVVLFQSMMMLSIKFYLNSKKMPQPFSKYKVLYNPVDTTAFEKLQLAPAQIIKEKRKLGIPPNAPVIGRVGRADVVKWGNLILESFPLILQKNPDCRLLLRGVPNSRKNWIALQSWRKNVIFLPETSVDTEIMKTYQLMDVYTHTSKIGEAFGNSLNEAAYFQKPIVTNSVPECDNGQLEQVLHGITGYIANTPEIFADAVNALLAQPELRAQMGKAGYQKVMDQYDAPKIASQLEKIYLDALKKNHTLSPKLLARFKKVEEHPTQKQLTEYAQNYDHLLSQQFRQPSFAENLRELLRQPSRLAWRLSDVFIVRMKN